MEWGVGGGLEWWVFPTSLQPVNPFLVCYLRYSVNIAPHSQSPAWRPWWEKWMRSGTEPSPRAARLPKVVPCGLWPGDACRVPGSQACGHPGLSFAAREEAVWVPRLLCSPQGWNWAPVSLVFRLSQGRIWREGDCPLLSFLPALPCRSERLYPPPWKVKGLIGTKMSMALPVPLALATTAKLGADQPGKSGSKIHYSEKLLLWVNLVKSRTATEHKLQKFQWAPFCWC